jgi:MFS family permease
LTVVVALFAYLFIHNYPSTAKFLTEPERAFIHARLKASTDAVNIEPFNWTNVRSALGDYKCWLYCFAFHTLSLPLYTLFLPTIISNLGYKAATAQLLTVPPYAFATLLTFITAILAEKTHRRAPFILASSALALIGYIILLSNAHPTQKPGISYLGTFFAAGGIYPSTAIVLSWPAANVSGQTKRATATAMTITIGNLGAVLGTQLYRPATSPRWFLGHGFAAGYLAGNLVVVSVLWWVLRRENERKRRRVGEVSGERGPVVNDEDERWIFQT